MVHRTRLLLVAAVLCRSVNGEQESTCRSDGQGQCFGGTAHAVPQALASAVVSSDGMRISFSRLLPAGGRPSHTRVTSPLSNTAIIPLSAGDTGNDKLGPFALVVLTFDRKAKWFFSGDGTSLEDRGSLHQGVGITSVASARGGGIMALGHQSGNISVWNFLPSGIASGWQMSSQLRPAHHEWESVTRVAVSADGSLVLACTDDNVVLWRIAPTGSDRRSGSSYDQPRELKHLHGGKYQVSAVDIGVLADGTPLIGIGFLSGELEVWVPSEDTAQVAWRLPRRDMSRFVALAVGVAAGAVGEEPCVVGGDAGGDVTLWKLKPDGSLLSRGGEPAWSRPVVTVGHTPSAVELLPAPSRVAVGVGSEVAILDSSTGKEVSARTRGPRGGIVVGLAWR